MMDAVNLILATAFRHSIAEPTVEMGYERFQSLTGGALDEGAFREAVATCVRDGLMHDPVRLEEGALQCHWRTELTSAGVEKARMIQKSPGLSRASTSSLSGKEGVDGRNKSGHDEKCAEEGTRSVGSV